MQLEQLRHLVNGRSIALVGNAQSFLENPHSGIDDHDVVVRINKGVFVARENAGIGKRTDILLVSGFVKSMNKFLISSTNVVYMSPSKRELILPELVERLFFYPVSWFEELSQEIGYPPSTGCMGVDLLKRLNGSGDLHLYGFDFWRSPTSYNGINRPGPHNPSAEEKFAMSRIPRKNLHDASFRCACR